MKESQIKEDYKRFIMHNNAVNHPFESEIETVRHQREEISREEISQEAEPLDKTISKAPTWRTERSKKTNLENCAMKYITFSPSSEIG